MSIDVGSQAPDFTLVDHDRQKVTPGDLRGTPVVLAFNEDMIGLKGIAKRAIFVIDQAGVVRHREVLEDARNEPDDDRVFAALS